MTEGSKAVPANATRALRSELSINKEIERFQRPCRETRCWNVGRASSRQSALSPPPGADPRLSLHDRRLGRAARAVARLLHRRREHACHRRFWSLCHSVSSRHHDLARACLRLHVAALSGRHRKAPAGRDLQRRLPGGCGALAAADRDHLRHHLPRPFFPGHDGERLFCVHAGGNHLLARTGNRGHRAEWPWPFRTRGAARGDRYGDPHRRCLALYSPILEDA
ncbi:hypothetical protein D9M72_392890 [compost metagenome]